MNSHNIQQTQPISHVLYGVNPTAVNPVFVQAVAMGDSPQCMRCPHCLHIVTTKVAHKDGTFTHVVAGILCLIGCWPCCLIPYCADGVKDTEHVCPNCNKFIGLSKRL